MSMLRLSLASSSLLLTLVASATAWSANDPNAPPPDPNGSVAAPQDPNAGVQGDGQGTVMVQPAPVQPVQVQPQQPPQPVPDEPPPRRTPMFGVAPSFHLPLVGNYAANNTYGGGLNLYAGYAFGNLSIAFSPGLFYYRGRGGFGELNLSLGATGRYTFLRDVIIHPFVELGLEYWLAITGTPLSHRGGGVGVSAALGAEIDVTDHLSLQVAARALLIAGGLESSITTATNDIVADFLLTPFVGLVYYR